MVLALFFVMAILIPVLSPLCSYANPLSDFIGGITSLFTADAGQEVRNVTTGDGISRVADDDTTQKYTLGNEDSTQYNGRVWVDKSVSAANSVQFGSIEVSNSSDFLVTYSALATSTITVGQTPTDTVFILDLSASMTWGYSESGRSVQQNQSRLEAMVNSLNSAIDTLVNANPENRIAIVTFNGTCTPDQALMSELITGREILKSVNDKKYLEIQNYDQNIEDGIDNASADVHCNITGNTASTSGGTNIQAGLFRGMSILVKNTDTKYESNGKTVTRIPNVILMSDGAPTTFSSSDNAEFMSYDTNGQGESRYYTPGKLIRNTTILGGKGDEREGSPVIRNTNFEVKSGDWWQTNSGLEIGAGNNNDPDSADGFMALLTASYFKNAISNNYYPDGSKEANIYTIGFGTNVQDKDMVAMANLVLNPGDYLDETTKFEQVNEVAEAWEAYNSGDRNVIVHAPIGDGSNSLHIPFEVERCSDRNNPTSLNYPTQYFSANDDEQLNQIFNEVATLITSSAMVPTEVTGDPESSGYITYTDTTGKYMEVKDVTTLIYMGQKVTNPEIDNQSDGIRKYTFTSEINNPAYPGDTHNTSEIQINVTDNSNHTQTIEVKIPASAIPLRTNTVTLSGDGEPTNNETSGTLPLRLCYEVGLEDGIDPTTLVGVDDDYINNNSQSGNINFYSNAYDADNAINKGVGATVEFKPAPTNPFYFIQEDTPLYVPNTGTENEEQEYERAQGELDVSTTYYVPITYYAGEGDQVKEISTYVKRSGATLSGFVSSDEEGLYIREGSPRLGNLSDVKAEKTNNDTGTYSNYREPTFVSDSGMSNPQNGHFVVLLGNNGKLSVPYVSKDVSLTNDSTHASIDGQLVGVGEKLHYTINWVNTDVENSGQVEVIDIIPEGTTYVNDSATTGSGVSVAYDEESHTLTWTIESTVGESSGTVEFDVTVGASAVDNNSNAISNYAKIKSGENEFTTNTTENYVPEKSVTMRDGASEAVDADGETVKPGTQLTYSIAYRNTESAAAKVEIKDAVPDGTTFVAATGDPKSYPNEGEAGNIIWTIDDVLPGETGSVTFTVKVSGTGTATAIIENAAYVQVGDHDPVVTNKVTTDVDQATLTIEKKVTADEGLTAPDGEFSFDLTIPTMASKQDVSATVRSGGEPSESRILNFDAEGKTTFKLEGDQSLEIVGVSNAQYTVVEKNAASGASTGGFKLSSISGNATSTSVENATASGKVSQSGTTVTFTNNYSVAPTTTDELNISLGGTKKIDGRNFLEGDAFTFTIEAANEAAETTLPASRTVTINPTSGDSVQFKFEKITFERPGTYSYLISEVNYDTDNNDETKNPGGLSYDPAVYQVSIVIEDSGNGTLRLRENPKVQVNNGAGGRMTDAEDNAVVFTNTYNPAATTATIQGTKKLNVKNSDYTLEEGDFSFNIAALGAARDTDKDSYDENDFSTYVNQPVPISSSVVNNANGIVSFRFTNGAFTKDMIGYTFGYKITESVGNLSADVVTMDQNTSRIVWVTVKDDGKGNVTTEVLPNDGGQQANNFTFTNSYAPREVTTEESSEIKVTKKVVGATSIEPFAFTLSLASDQDGSNVRVKTSDGMSSVFNGLTATTGDAIPAGESETISFGPITFTSTGDYRFVIDEATTTTDSNWVYDDSTHEVTVHVKDEGGQLVIDGIDGNNPTFTNTYNEPDDPYIPPTQPDPDPSDPTKPNLPVTKTLGGRDMIAGEFSFQIEATGSNASQVSPQTLTGTNDANGNVSFSGDGFTFKKAGTYEFTVSEVLPADDDPNTEGVQHNGVTYDGSTYTITAKVTKGSNNKLEVTWDLGTLASGVTFANAYEPSETAQIVFGATKVLNGRDLAAGEFTFELRDQSGNVVATATNAADGSVVFSEPVEFTEAGTYTYTISEVKGDLANVTYDGSTHTATVTVTDNGDGTLTATVSYDGAGQLPTFVNTYAEPEEPATPEQPGTPGQPGGPEVPDTGDHTNGILPTVLCLGGVALVAGAVALKRRRSR